MPNHQTKIIAAYDFFTMPNLTYLAVKMPVGNPHVNTLVPVDQRSCCTSILVSAGMGDCPDM